MAVEYFFKKSTTQNGKFEKLYYLKDIFSINDESLNSEYSFFETHNVCLEGTKSPERKIVYLAKIPLYNIGGFRLIANFKVLDEERTRSFDLMVDCNNKFYLRYHCPNGYLYKSLSHVNRTSSQSKIYTMGRVLNAKEYVKCLFGFDIADKINLEYDSSSIDKSNNLDKSGPQVGNQDAINQILNTISEDIADSQKKIKKYTTNVSKIKTYMIISFTVLTGEILTAIIVASCLKRSSMWSKFNTWCIELTYKITLLSLCMITFGALYLTKKLSNMLDVMINEDLLNPIQFSNDIDDNELEYIDDFDERRRETLNKYNQEALHCIANIRGLPSRQIYCDTDTSKFKEKEHQHLVIFTYLLAICTILSLPLFFHLTEIQKCDSIIPNIENPDFNNLIFLSIPITCLAVFAVLKIFTSIIIKTNRYIDTKIDSYDKANTTNKENDEDQINDLLNIDVENYSLCLGDAKNHLTTSDANDLANSNHTICIGIVSSTSDANDLANNNHTICIDSVPSTSATSGINI